MIKIFALFALGAQALLDKCGTGIATPVRNTDSLDESEAFCQKFCSKYEGKSHRGICGIQATYPACYRQVVPEGENEVKPKFCDPVECFECLNYMNKGGFCSCGFDCYTHEQGKPLHFWQQKRHCSRVNV